MACANRAVTTCNKSATFDHDENVGRMRTDCRWADVFARVEDVSRTCLHVLRTCEARVKLRLPRSTCSDEASEAGRQPIRVSEIVPAGNFSLAGRSV